VIKMEIDQAAFSYQLKRYALAKKISFSKAIKQQGRLVAVNLAFQTQPFGDGSSAKEKGQGAVSRDIKRVFKPAKNTTGVIKRSDTQPGQTKTQNAEQAARVFAGYVLRGQNAKATEILQRLNIPKYFSAIVAPVDGAKHQSARHGSRRTVPKNQFVGLVIPKENTLESYVKKISQNVGIAKGGWADCAKKLGGSRGIPGWASRHAGKRAKGSVLDNSSGTGDDQSVTMTNHVPWIDKCLNAGQIQRALDIQKEKMTKAIEIALSKA
jgi:hypothetical protein